MTLFATSRDRSSAKRPSGTEYVTAFARVCRVHTDSAYSLRSAFRAARQIALRRTESLLFLVAVRTASTIVRAPKLARNLSARRLEETAVERMAESAPTCEGSCASSAAKKGRPSGSPTSESSSTISDSQPASPIACANRRPREPAETSSDETCCTRSRIRRTPNYSLP